MKVYELMSLLGECKARAKVVMSIDDLEEKIPIAIVIVSDDQVLLADTTEEEKE